MAFYDGRCLDPTGGFFHFFKDDGTVYDRTTRHLVSSTRFVFTQAMAARRFGETKYLDATRHALRFLREAHRDPATGGYAWQLSWDNGRKTVLDATNHCYGLAFVLLAHAHAAMAGIAEARAGIAETFELMEQRFWEPANGLYADEATADWQVLPYRGQNANMHACEAMLAAYEATSDQRYLDRAAVLADSVTRRLAQHGKGMVWEHYRIDPATGGWTPDWDYNRHDKTNIFRPWGYQPGHHTEWSKLLLILDRHQPADWLLPRSQELFAAGTEHAWDTAHGGLVYGIADDEKHHGKMVVCDGDKYFWVQAESLATAALLALRTGEGGYWDWYDRLWDYSWEHFVDHEHGAWYRILTPDNKKISDEKSPAGKVDYHTMGACYEVWAALEAA
ncbi:AGE family epimerase/isomerase [Piscinibacter terrae]|uniref:AGE family epimerase/isomerase n=1 Tax=Piscinibacter terrae TaxID=2496871 RepID=A0A3N7HVN6_9BURK|nr:AGE family epimerase/isomerase [Albitalea terrae]RQP25426.1 AGE family epimerase/isomerase [Albitalea terrae]